jgi:cell wall-associated NlpC family hydrolase
LIALLAVVALSGTAVGSAFASPTNAKISAARKKAVEARAELDDLSDELEERNEQYLEIESQLQETRGRIGANEAQIEAAKARYDSVQALLANRVSTMYRRGSATYVSVLLGVSDFGDLVTRLDLMRRIGASDASLVADVRSARDELDEAHVALERRKSEQIVLRDRARRAQERMEEALRRQKAYLAGLSAKIKKLVAEERERQERLAREAAARAAAGSGSTHPPGRTFDPDALGEPHGEAVVRARKYLGVKYVWGGTTPRGFDCSGLTQYCYRAIGIAIPRTSRQQFHTGAFIPPDRLDLLKPGDLVFFGRNGDPDRIHHVAMFVGDGMMLHAPQTGDVVRIQSLLGRIASRADYVGAVRP